MRDGAGIPRLSGVIIAGLCTALSLLGLYVVHSVESERAHDAAEARFEAFSAFPTSALCDEPTWHISEDRKVALAACKINDGSGFWFTQSKHVLSLEHGSWVQRQVRDVPGGEGDLSSVSFADAPKSLTEDLWNQLFDKYSDGYRAAEGLPTCVMSFDEMKQREALRVRYGDSSHVNWVLRSQFEQACDAADAPAGVAH